MPLFLNSKIYSKRVFIPSLFAIKDANRNAIDNIGGGKPRVYWMDAVINGEADSIIDIPKQALAQMHAEIDISSLASTMCHHLSLCRQQKITNLR